jgi:hypothetical protein
MPAFILEDEVPRQWNPHMTLAECKRKFDESDFQEVVREVVEPAAKRYTYDFRLRFVRTSDQTDLPDSLLLHEFCALANQKLARMIVEEGGRPVEVLPKELVF